MKIGIFDSGLGGLVIARSIFKQLPKYDYLYLGDTKNLPYGEKSPQQIYRNTKTAVDFLFRQNCQLIIIACNTSSAWALRKIQRGYLAKNYPNRRVLGVIIPTLEEADKNRLAKKIGVIATAATVKSHIYKKELSKIDKKAKVYEIAAPKLVPLIEKNALPKATNALKLYLEPLKHKSIDGLILGCTHYPLLKKQLKKIMGLRVKIIAQDEIIPNKLTDYLKRHPEINSKLSRSGKRIFFVTELNSGFKQVAKRLFGRDMRLILAKI